MNELQTQRLIDLLAIIAASLAEIARNTQRELPEEPDLQRPIEQFAGFDWSAIDATVVRADEFGPSLIEWGGRLWTRRSPENKFGEAIWYSRSAGKDADGNNRYLRLITFKRVAEAEPLSRAAEKAVHAGAGYVTPPVVSAPAEAAAKALVTPVTPPPSAPPAQAQAESDRQFADLPSASEQVVIAPKPAPAPGPQVSPGAAVPTDPSLCPTCGKSWKYESTTNCPKHGPPNITATPAAPAHANRPQANLGAGLVGGQFREWARDLAHRNPKYQVKGSTDPNLYMILKIIGNLDPPVAEITLDNIEDVKARMEAHAAAA